MMSNEEIIRYKYRLIGRLLMDIEYYIGFGQRNLSDVEIKNIFKEIEKLLKEVPEKPVWLTDVQLKCLKYVALRTSLTFYDTKLVEDGIILSKPIQNRTNGLFDSEEIVTVSYKNKRYRVDSKIYNRSWQ